MTALVQPSRVAHRFAVERRTPRAGYHRLLTLLVLAAVAWIAPAQSAVAAQAVDVVFVLDNSGSMRTNDPSFLTRRAVSDFAAAIGDNDEIDARIALVFFDTNVELAQSLTPIGDANSRSELNFALSALDFSGQYTNSPAGIERALYELRQNGREDARKAIVFISDGKIDTGDGQNDLEVARWLREDLAKESENHDIRIFGVAFTEAADYQLMQALARRTHARYYRAFEASELSGVVTDVLKRVDTASTYDLAFAEPPTAFVASGDLSETAAPSTGATDPDEWTFSRSLAWLPLLLLLGVGAALARRRWASSGRGASFGNPPPQPPPAQLLDFGGLLGEPGASIPLTLERNTIGRDPNNTLVIQDDTISSEHAVIETRDGLYWLQDRRSTNGTRLADKRIPAEQSFALKGGDRIRFADVDLMFVVEGYVPGGDTVYLKSSTTPPPERSYSEMEASSPSSRPRKRPLERPTTSVDDAFGSSDEGTELGFVESQPSAPPVEGAAGAVPPILPPTSEEGDAADGPSQEIVFAEERERLDPASVLDLDHNLPASEVAAAQGANASLENDGEAVARADRVLAAISEDGEAPPPLLPPNARREPQPDADFDPIDAPTAEVQIHPDETIPPAPATISVDAAALRECLDYHLDRVAEISPDFAAFVRRGFQDELRTALPIAAKELIEQANKSDVICQRAYTFDRVRYVVCGVPGGMNSAQKYFIESFGGFTRVLSEHLGAASFRTDRCEILALLTFGYEDAPWVSLSIVPDEGQSPRIDLLSYEFLTDQERQEIEPKVDPQVSQSGLA